MPDPTGAADPHAGHDHDHDHDHDDGHDHGHGPDAGVRPVTDLARYDGIQGWVLRENGACERELLAVLPPESLADKVNEAASRLARRVTLKGFRPGKAPVARIKALYGDDLKRDAIEALVQATWKEAAEAKSLRPVLDPALTELSAQDGQPIRFALKFEILPVVTLQDLAFVRVDNKTVKVTPKDVEDEVEGLRSLHARLEPSGKDQAGPGDFAIVDLDRFAPEADPVSASPTETRSGAAIELGNQSNMPELERALLGMTTGEARTFVAKFPAEHPDADLAGKDVPMRVSLKEVRSRRLPALDEAFVARLGRFGSVEAFREDVRKGLLESRRSQASREQDEQAMDQLLSRHPFEVPKTLIEREADSRLRRGLEGLVRRGVDLKAAKIDWDGEFRRAREAAERDIRAEYLLELVAKSKGVEVSQAEVDREMESLAAREGMPYAAFRKELERTKQVNNLRSSMRRRRALDLLKSGATIQVE